MRRGGSLRPTRLVEEVVVKVVHHGWRLEVVPAALMRGDASSGGISARLRGDQRQGETNQRWTRSPQFVGWH